MVDALPESHRDTAAAGAERLLIDPETDLLSRRWVAEGVPDNVVAEVRRAVFAGHKLRIHYAAVDQAPKWLRTSLRNRDRHSLRSVILTGLATIGGWLNEWVGVTVDCIDVQRVATFWSTLLGREPGPSEEGWI